MSLKTPVHYKVYTLTGEVKKESRTSKFTLKELQELVGGNVEFLPTSHQGTLFVVHEDGFHCCAENPSFPETFYGVVVEVPVKLIN